MSKTLSSIEAIKAALPDIGREVQEEIAARVAAGEAVDSFDEKMFKHMTIDRKLEWAKALSGDSNRQKRAA